MAIRLVRLRAVPPAIVVIAIALAGCSASVSTGGGLDSGEVAEEAQAQLTKVSEERGGGAFPEVECPDQIEEDVGSKTICHSSFDGTRHEIQVTVTAKDGDTVNLHFDSDALPSG